MSQGSVDLSGWSHRDEARREATARGLAGIEAARARIADILRTYGVAEAYLFGSVVRGTPRSDSDVDLAVAGCPPRVFYRLAAEIERALAAPLDLVDLDRAPPDFAVTIRRDGTCIYPRRVEQAVTKSELPVLRAQLSAERQRLHDVIEQVEALRTALGDRPPTVVELMAAAGFLHNVYNAIENCMKRIAHAVDESFPDTPDSHPLLVDQMSAPVDGIRPALLPRGLIGRIDEYRRFRDAFRHMYYFDLDWQRLQPLLTGARAVAADFEGALDELLSSLGA